MMSNKENTGEYGSEQITVLEGLEAVRKRPGMYIGGTGKDGLFHILKEIIDNAVDEGIAGYCDTITVELFKDNSIAIADNGRGIPIEIHEKTGKTALETVLTILHAGGKFGGGGYKVSSGLHGVGLTVTNATSEWMKVNVYKNGKEYEIGLSRGNVTEEFSEVGESKITGTRVAFKPDHEIFETTHIDAKTLIASLKHRAYLVGGLRFIFKNYRDSENTEPIVEEFFYEGGIRSYVEGLVEPERMVGKVFHVKSEELETAVEVGFAYSDRVDYDIHAYANLVINPEGGTHLTGFKQALTKTLNDYARKNNFLKEKDENFTGEDILEGITAIISVKLEDPQFEGQTKIKLNNTEVAGHVKTILNESLTQWLEEDPKNAKAILNKCLLSQKARKAAKAARDSIVRKSILESAGMPGKLADCSEKNPEKCELFIVEGDSAGGSAKMGRDRHNQAILPLRGKPLNPEKSRIDKVLAHIGLKQLIQALGTGIGDTFDISKLRYHKIILLADADVDGSHITTLLLTFFFRQMKELITHGHVYLAQPPLYRLIVGKAESYYVADDVERAEKIKELQADGKKVNRTTRFKGLGEMNPDQLYETTIGTENRTLKQVTIEDAEEADKIFETLMGTLVPPRKAFIEANATYAELDV